MPTVVTVAYVLLTRLLRVCRRADRPDPVDEHAAMVAALLDPDSLPELSTQELDAFDDAVRSYYRDPFLPPHEWPAGQNAEEN